ncbi:MAG TPA: hypothetical protein VG034_00430 [Acidimicrobiia bacterium]|nr:hypothetical protein [Acidimicrobiia bacterium]
MDAPARAPEDLYGLPLEEFTPARDALAKELKAAGRKDEAAEVKSLRKPSLAAWALNRVAREQAAAIDGLRAAGADLRQAQDEAMSGDAGRLREANRALADEVNRVAGLAVEVLRAAGRPGSAAQQEKIVATLRTAAVDDEAGDALARGVLVEELESTGFSLLGPGSGKVSTPSRPSKKPKASKEALEAVEAARRELRRCDAEAEMAATRARRRAERAETAAKRAAEAQREAEQARADAEEARGVAEAARRAANEAAAHLAAAEAALPS